MPDPTTEPTTLILELKRRSLPLAGTVAIALVIWLVPAPEGVDLKAWHLLAIFVATIAGLIAKPLPMGAVAMLGDRKSVV